MAENFSRNILRIVIAQLGQAVGFDSIQSSSLDVLTNVLERYLLMIGKNIHDFGEQRGQTIPHLGDVEASFQHLHISLADIVDYTRQMEPIEFAHKVAKFPAPKESNLKFPSGNNPKDFNRDEHIPLYMPSMVAAPEKPTTEVKNTAGSSKENQQGKKATSVIAGKHSQGSSSDEDEYSAGDASNEEYMSDDSLSHNPTKSRHLTKPEDIPTIEGTAPSSLMSMPSSAELDESPASRTSFEGADDQVGRMFGRERKISGQTPKFGLIKKTSAGYRPSQDLSWLVPDKSTPNAGKWKTPDSNPSKSTEPNSDPDWLSQKKKIKDVYDPGWLQNDGGSVVHLMKPSMADVPLGSPTEKRSWFGKDKEISPLDAESSKTVSKKQPGTKHKVGHSLSSTPSQKYISKSNVERKSSHHKPGYKSSPFVKIKKEKGILGNEPIKARIEAAERLLHSAPVAAYQPSSPKSFGLKAQSRPSPKSPVRSNIEKAEKLLKYPPVEDLSFSSSREPSPSISKQREKVTEKSREDKADKLNFASSKSMYDAIDAVIHRATEETSRNDEQARKEAEEAELMKFSHLVEDSSSSDSEPDITEKAEEMLQLQERGLQKTKPPTPGSSPLPSPSSGETPSRGMEEEEEDVTVDSDSGDSIRLPPKKSYEYNNGSSKVKSKLEKSSKKEKHKKKVKQKPDHSPHRSSSKSKKDKHSQKPMSFVTTETILEKPVKMKVKLKPFGHKEPKLFDVNEDSDRIRIHTLKSSKEERQRSKDGKHHKDKEYKKHTPKLSMESKPSSSGVQDMSVEKIILKKSKSGDTKVVKPKVKEHNRSPSPPSPVANRSNLPLPKLSAAVPVMSVTATVKEKDKKKSKKEKKKKKDKERGMEREWSFDKEKSRKEIKDKSHQKEKHRDTEQDSSRRNSLDSDIASPMVPKLTLKMGTSEKKFVIKQSVSNTKSSGSVKRSHSSVDDGPIPPKDRKVSAECVKTVSGGFAAAVERRVITQTISAGPVGVYEDAEGNKVWICPECNKPDDGSPMIGCDTCDDWYHWPCVGINKEPPDDQDWYCPRCVKKQQLAKAKGSTKKRKKK